MGGNDSHGIELLANTNGEPIALKAVIYMSSLIDTSFMITSLLHDSWVTTIVLLTPYRKNFQSGKRQV